MSKTLYRCPNESCPLGTNGVANGQFTGGRTAEQATLVTGEPAEHLEKGKHYGEGVCPNCGTQGVEHDAAAEQREQLKAAKDAYDEHVAAIRKGGA